MKSCLSFKRGPVVQNINFSVHAVAVLTAGFLSIFSLVVYTFAFYCQEYFNILEILQWWSWDSGHVRQDITCSSSMITSCRSLFSPILSTNSINLWGLFRVSYGILYREKYIDDVRRYIQFILKGLRSWTLGKKWKFCDVFTAPPSLCGIEEKGVLASVVRLSRDNQRRFQFSFFCALTFHATPNKGWREAGHWTPHKTKRPPPVPFLITREHVNQNSRALPKRVRECCPPPKKKKKNAAHRS